MGKLKLVIVISTIFMLVACSDFFNSEEKKAGSSQNQIQSGFKPFPEGYNPNQGPFSQEKLIANIGLNVIVPGTQALRLQAEILNLELENWLSRDNRKEDQKKVIHTQWKKVMTQFHFLEGIPLGPLSDKQLGLSEQIYSWPYSNLCGVDHEVLKFSVSNQASVSSLFTLKGLSVLEYLLFDETYTTTCNPQSARNKPVVQWTLKNQTEKEFDRMFYASKLTQDLIEKTKQLESLWNPNTNNFTMSLLDGSLYPEGIKKAVNAMSDSLFSLEKLKDLKMAKPLGLHKDCLSDFKKCPESVEHSWSQISYDSIRAQAEGFKAAFNGEGRNINGFGFDDFLVSIGRQDVSTRLNENIDQFLRNLGELEVGLAFQQQIEAMDILDCSNSTIQNRIVPVCSLFQDLRVITTQMKTEFLIALSLQAPPTYQGDND